VNKVFPHLSTKCSYYEFFKNQNPAKEDLKIIIADMPRTYDGKSDWSWPKEFKAEYEIGGNNPLFNVLIAYANYDKEFGYG